MNACVSLPSAPRVGPRRAAIVAAIASLATASCSDAKRADPARAWSVVRTGDARGVFMAATTLSDGTPLVVGGTETRGAAFRLVADDLVDEHPPEGPLLAWASDAGEGETWAVGNGRRALRRDAAGAWSAEATPSGDELWGCKAFSRDEVWAVGADVDAADVATPTIVRRAASGWATVPFPTVTTRDARLYKIDGDGPSNLVAVGTQGLVLAWDGHAWTSEASGTGISLTTVRAIGDGRFVAVGGWVDSGTGVILLRDASRTWTKLSVAKAGLAGFDRVGDDLWSCGVRGWLQRTSLAGDTLYEPDHELTRDSLHFVLHLPGGDAISGGGDFSAWTGTIVRYAATP